MGYLVIVILVGILIVIAGLLLAAEKALGGGGDKMLVINDEKVIPVSGDDTLLNTLSSHKIFIPSACGGKATCGFCKCKIVEGGGEVKPTELPFLNESERKEGVRLSCQVKIRDNMKIEIPKELLNAQEYKTRVSYIE
ncbi:MAG: oxidoreductase, partial [Tenericutes bacterium HGW-Tenericutes-6]